MKKIKAFIHVFTKSLTSVDYYKDVVKTNIGFSFRYYALLVLILTLVTATQITITNIPTVTDSIDEGVIEMLNLYPDELVIHKEQGVVSINQPEPYFIELPEPGNLSQNGEKPIANIVVFDSQGTIEDLEKYETVALVNNKNLLVQNARKVQGYPLKDMPDGEYTKADIVALADQITGYKAYVPYVLFAVFFIGVGMYYWIVRLAVLVVVALGLATVGKIKGLTLPFGKYYQIGIHTITLPFVLELISDLVHQPINITGWFFAVNIIFGMIVVLSLAKENDPTPVVANGAGEPTIAKKEDGKPANS